MPRPGESVEISRTVPTDHRVLRTDCRVVAVIPCGTRLRIAQARFNFRAVPGGVPRTEGADNMSSQRIALRRGVPGSRGILMAVLAAALCCACFRALAQASPALKESTVYNRPVYLLSLSLIHISEP